MTPVMSFTKEEMETVLLYDYITDTWSVHTNVPRHISRLFKVVDEDKIEVLSVTKNGKPNQIQAKGLKKLVGFRNTKESE